MRIWGFDLGTTSIGSAVIEYDPARQAGSILWQAVRIFPEGRDNDLEPKNKTRRDKRLARRQIKRRRVRRRLLNHALFDAGLLPKFGTPDWQEVMKLDPYPLRVKGLTGPLSALELGRAIYHQTKRRHFRERDHGIEEDKPREKDPDEIKARKGREALLHELQQYNQTLGQYLAGKNLHERKRGFHATRAVVEEEFNKIWKTQARHHSVLTDAFRKRIEGEIVFFQRPTFWRLSTLRGCPLEPGKEPCPRAYWLSQQRRMLDQVNNLRFAGGNARTLTPDERDVILKALSGNESLSFSKARKALKEVWKDTGDMPGKAKFSVEVEKKKKSNDDTGSAREISGNIVEAALVKAFGDRWPTHPHKERLRRELPERLWKADYQRIGNKRVEIRFLSERMKRRNEVVLSLGKDFDLTEQEAVALAQTDLPSGWDKYSTAAIERMLPLLESGVPSQKLLNSFDPQWIQWREETFPRRQQPTGEILDRLPSHPSDMPEVRNPTVARVLNELRKVVNNLLPVYGRPDVIRIELARNVGKPKVVREAIDQANDDRKRDRDRARKDLQEKRASTSEENVEKWLLWEECKKQCPYTGKHICFDDLFGKGLFQIEHIWPRSISCDNRWVNKTLCCVEENKRKGKRIPYEVYGHDQEKWDELKRRLESIGLPENKIKRFLAQKIPEGLCERQLRDTSWAARAARDFLARLWPDEGEEKPRPVETVNGFVTSQLRERWGLNYLLGDTGKKNRADHRHHAVDALVVACSSPAFVKRLSDYYKAEEERRDPFLPKPWSAIREDAERFLPKIRVSYRVQKKLSGPLHEERPLGLINKQPETPEGLVLARRKPLDEISDTEVEYIADAAIQKLVLEQAPTKEARKKLSNHGLRLPDRTDHAGRIVRKVRLHVERQPSAVKKLNPPRTINGKSARQPYVELGQSLRHIAFYRSPGGEIFHCTETRLGALKNTREEKAPVRKKLEDGSELLFSLCKGDILEQKTDDGVKYLVVRKVNQNGRIFYKPATMADMPKPEVSFGPTSFADGTLTKVSVDPIGRVRPARD